jgi:hypothetical protein
LKVRSAFGGIAAVDAGRGELEVIFFVADELFQCTIGALIVETLEAGMQAGGAKFGMEVLKSGKNGGAHAVFDGFGEDAFAVIIVHNDQVIVVASAGWDRESAGLVAEYFSGWFEEGGITKVGAVIRSRTGREEIVIGGEELGVVGKTRGWCNTRCLFGLFGGALV